MTLRASIREADVAAAARALEQQHDIMHTDKQVESWGRRGENEREGGRGRMGGREMKEGREGEGGRGREEGE